jgi:3-oxoacyl-[acyl-carrier protein] reductase
LPRRSFSEGGWGFPDDIGKAVAGLARGDFSFSTGQFVMVDGGLTIPRL